MKLSTPCSFTPLLLLLSAGAAGAAFLAPAGTAGTTTIKTTPALLGPTVGSARTILRSSSTTKDATESSSAASASRSRRNLLETAERLKSRYGVFLVEKGAKEELQDAVAALESSASGNPPVLSSDFLGEWELLCTTVTSQQGIDTSKFPSPLLEPLQQIRDSVTKTANKYVKVEQIIQPPEDGTTFVDRVDHVIEYMPPEELQDVLDNLPEPLKSVNINPLHVSRSKLVLVHKAEVESIEQPLKIGLTLQSIVLNVAGTPTFLDPKGKDVTGINLPLGEFLSHGTFETTYLDETLRVSRGQTVAGNQLRVFTRRLPTSGAVEPEVVSKESVPEVDVDVDEAIDPEFSSDSEAPSDVEADEL